MPQPRSCPGVSTGAVACLRRLNPASAQPISSLPVTSRPMVTTSSLLMPAFQKVGDEGLQSVRRARIAGLGQVGRQDEVLGTDLLDCCRTLLDRRPCHTSPSVGE